MGGERSSPMEGWREWRESKKGRETIRKVGRVEVQSYSWRRIETGKDRWMHGINMGVR
jgi:hypothetical protein